MDSFLEKIDRKQYVEPLEEMPDLAGVRVVCLFMSDLNTVTRLLEEHFRVLLKEDKINEGDVSRFGYMSVHYECSLGSQYAGPRYDALKDLRFELQCRTIVMDAWANVSHVLAYKGEASIPDELRKDFHALSALFYVAERYFQLFGETRNEVAAEAVQLVESGAMTSAPLNTETLRAFIEARYPDRSKSDRESISEIVERLHKHGYRTIDQIERILDQVDPITVKYEAEHPPRGAKGRRFADVGMINIGFAIFDIKYDRSRFEAYAQPGKIFPDGMKKYRAQLEPK